MSERVYYLRCSNCDHTSHTYDSPFDLLQPACANPGHITIQLPARMGNDHAFAIFCTETPIQNITQTTLDKLALRFGTPELEIAVPCVSSDNNVSLKPALHCPKCGVCLAGKWSRSPIESIRVSVESIREAFLKAQNTLGLPVVLIHTNNDIISINHTIRPIYCTFTVPSKATLFVNCITCNLSSQNTIQDSRQWRLHAPTAQVLTTTVDELERTLSEIGIRYLKNQISERTCSIHELP